MRAIAFMLAPTRPSFGFMRPPPASLLLAMTHPLRSFLEKTFPRYCLLCLFPLSRPGLCRELSLSTFFLRCFCCLIGQAGVRQCIGGDRASMPGPWEERTPLGESGGRPQPRTFLFVFAPPTKFIPRLSDPTRPTYFTSALSLAALLPETKKAPFHPSVGERTPPSPKKHGVLLKNAVAA